MKVCTQKKRAAQPHISNVHTIKHPNFFGVFTKLPLCEFGWWFTDQGELAPTLVPSHILSEASSWPYEAQKIVRFEPRDPDLGSEWDICNI